MTTAAETLPARPQPSVAARAWAFVRRHALAAYSVLALTYLMLPIAVVILFSFNDPAPSSTTPGKPSRSTTGSTGTRFRESATP